VDQQDTAKALARLQKASQRVRQAESGLASARLELRVAIVASYEAGASMTAIGEVLGITRQRVKQLLDER
jgi:DNA-directed RNA polymerase sigma subunit (sigma70/sigma32)